MTHWKVMFNKLGREQNIDVTEQMLGLSYSTVYCGVSHHFWRFLPGEPCGTSGKSHSRRFPSSALWTLDNLCLETLTAWEIENNSTTSVNIIHIYCRCRKSSGHNYVHFTLENSGGISAHQVHSWGEHRQQHGPGERLSKFLFHCVRLLRERKYLCGSAAHLVLGPRDGVHWNRTPE